MLVRSRHGKKDSTDSGMHDDHDDPTRHSFEPHFWHSQLCRVCKEPMDRHMYGSVKTEAIRRRSASATGALSLAVGEVFNSIKSSVSPKKNSPKKSSPQKSSPPKTKRSPKKK